MAKRGVKLGTKRGSYERRSKYDSYLAKIRKYNKRMPVEDRVKTLDETEFYSEWKSISDANKMSRKSKIKSVRENVPASIIDTIVDIQTEKFGTQVNLKRFRNIDTEMYKEFFADSNIKQGKLTKYNIREFMRSAPRTAEFWDIVSRAYYDNLSDAETLKLEQMFGGPIAGMTIGQIFFGSE